jgi:hypothetical protein
MGIRACCSGCGNSRLGLLKHGLAVVDEVDLTVVGAEHLTCQQANKTGTAGDVEDGLARLDVREPDESLIAVDAGVVIGGPHADAFGAVVRVVHTVLFVVVCDAVQCLRRGLRGHLGGCRCRSGFDSCLRRLQRADSRWGVSRGEGVRG